MNTSEKGAMYAQKFKNKYGDREIELERQVMTIYDSYPSPFSSGSNGYITKARLNNGTLEFYHNWWRYGWFSYEEMHKDYPRAVNSVIKQLGLWD